MRPDRHLIAACGLALAGAAWAQGSGSLQERRLGVIKGSAPGITLIEAPRPAASAAAAPASAPLAAAPTPAPAPSPVAAAPKPAASAPPQAATPIGAARRLDSPSLGITLPTGAPAASAAGRP